MKKHLPLYTTLLFLIPSVVLAHIKWFVDYDLADKPASFQSIFSPSWLMILPIVLICIYIFFIIDRYFYRRDIFINFELLCEKISPYYFVAMRILIAIYFFSLWLYGHFIIAPELKTNNFYLLTTQLVIAILILLKRMSQIAAALMIALYVYCIYKFNLFHMLDYLVYLGVTIYILLAYYQDRTSGKALNKIRNIKIVTLLLSLSITLAWGAMEKFFYMSRYITLLKLHEHITFGIPPEIYTLLAGFTEFSLAFLLVVGAFVCRAVSFMLLIIFLTAIYEFGTIDAVGHLLILASFALLMTTGPAKLSQRFVFNNLPVWIESFILVLLYAATLGLFMLLYPGLHYLLV